MVTDYLRKNRTSVFTNCGVCLHNTRLGKINNNSGLSCYLQTRAHQVFEIYIKNNLNVKVKVIASVVPLFLFVNSPVPKYPNLLSLHGIFIHRHFYIISRG